MKQTSGSKDQGPYMWSLILVPACLQLYKNTDRSVSRLKWVNPLLGVFEKKCMICFCFPARDAETKIANETLDHIEGMIRLDDSACRMITSPLGPGSWPNTETDLRDWSFRSARMCEPLDVDGVSKIRTKVSLNCDESPPTLSTTKTDQPHDVFTVEFDSTCLEAFIDGCCMDENPVPNVVHFVWFTDKELGYFNFLSLLSTVR